LSTYKPDIVGRGLEVIFCGPNPAASAAVAGHNFSNRSNRFWTVLYLAGFTDVLLRPQDEHRLLKRISLRHHRSRLPADQAGG
jgi:TDG/mug DNA glycosylase family protein